ncbi:class I SAM-dependent methyltransferase [Marivirga arenosa]|uniref:Class I SAM-dependent methyltransferase n=1 Tax=Marivirga arenosa TaxID=3059076 RepID=A0AA51ZWD6_9BACT|nr:MULTISPECIES: class I SAM-dependent methyltransferase [unclassified Marivirga]WKK86501.2 class I SAM-dependent methyltransferase [Marivirga sp. ABR2-2]WNB17957.1 class I SAM-dependent methyltransferase [Marivirga sp. BKB1-2]
MAKHSTTEITSDSIASDNPIHQRLLAAYIYAQPSIEGNLLEIGCGTGRGLQTLVNTADHYTGIDKYKTLTDELQAEYPQADFKAMHIPPLKGIEDNSFDTVVSFQVIEHIKDDITFLKEIHRVLKPGGKAIISTPNKKMTLTRNPWHVREYFAPELEKICKSIFSKVEANGIAGNDKVMEYHEKNRESVRKITKFDIFNLQYRLPAPLLRIPYEFLNRVNRNKLDQADNSLVKSISVADYYVNENAEESLDLFYTLEK